jgi:hypothetical protein
LRAIALKWLNNQTPPASGGLETFAREAAALIGDDGDPL